MIAWFGIQDNLKMDSNMIHYSMVWDTRWLKNGLQNVVSNKQEDHDDPVTLTWVS